MNPQLYENYPRFIHTLCRGSYSSPQGQLPGKYQTEIFIFFIFPPFHLGSCLGNFGGNYSFFRHLCSHLKNIRKKDISYFTYSLRFFISSSADIKYYWTFFLSENPFSPPTSMDGQEIFFPVCTKCLRDIMKIFVILELFSPPMSLDGQRNYFHRVCTECMGYIMKISFVSEYFFLLLHLWMNRRRENIFTDFAQSAWEFRRLDILKYDNNM